jgi:diacylglycerol kinase family enzyme
VVAAGGDGTVVKVIGELRGRNLPLAIVPLGGANNVARSLGITGDPFAIARAGWRNAIRRPLDIGIAAGPWGQRLFVEAVGIGTLAEAAAAIDLQNVRGPEKSELACACLLEMLAEARPSELRLTIDGQQLVVRCLLAEIMNIRSTGPRLELAPAADPGDGLLDLVWLAPARRAEMLAWLEGTAPHPPPLTTERGRVFAFEWGHGRLHVADSFPPPPARPCAIEVALLPEPATVLVPILEE